MPPHFMWGLDIVEFRFVSWDCSTQACVQAKGLDRGWSLLWRTLKSGLGAFETPATLH
jgi:hypothetical protein